MKVIWGLENAEFQPATITTLGSYDGVHLGHRAILNRLNAQKRERGFERSVLLTFHPHPQEVLRKNNTSIKLLTTIEERIDLLSRTGIDETIVIPFTEQFAATSYRDFFKQTLLERLGTKMMVVGFNHAFGKNREGDSEHLKLIAGEHNVIVEEVPPLTIESTSVSSTKIRHALERGELSHASAMLGRTYSFSGNVIAGDKIGRELGYPTANLGVSSEKLLPSDGVYACVVQHGGYEYEGALSIGHRPTIGEYLELAVELFLLDFKGDLYGEKLDVLCKEYLRPQIRFESLDALKGQIEIDVAACRALLKNKSIFA